MAGRRKRGPSLDPARMEPASKRRAAAVSPHIEDILGIPVDMDEFSQPTNDHHGHTTQLRVSLLPGFVIELEHVVESRRWPYRNSQDLIRHAVARHLRWLTALYPSPTVQGQVQALLITLRNEEFMLDFEQVLDKTQEMVTRHVSARHPEMARTLLKGVEAQIATMPEGNWKRKYEEQFAQQFGGMME